MIPTNINPPSHYLLKLQIFNTSPHFGKGILSLMLLIKEGHSIRSASQKMNMAYSKAWRLIQVAENDLGYPLISKKKGGSTRAGSELSPEGEWLLAQFMEFESAVQRSADELFRQYFGSGA